VVPVAHQALARRIQRRFAWLLHRITGILKDNTTDRTLTVTRVSTTPAAGGCRCR
jgi:hypothetical protein